MDNISQTWIIYPKHGKYIPTWIIFLSIDNISQTWIFQAWIKYPEHG